MMVGLDGDTLDTFERTLAVPGRQQGLVPEALHAVPVSRARSTTTTCAKAGRILGSDWGRYDYGCPLIRPASMTPDEMMDGFKYVYEGFYSTARIAAPLLPPPTRQLPRDASRTSSPT